MRWWHSQPSLHNPTLSQAWDVVILDGSNFNQGPTDPNQHWDYSNSQVDMGFPLFQFSILNPANAPFDVGRKQLTEGLQVDLGDFAPGCISDSVEMMDRSWARCGCLSSSRSINL